ncbi:MAG: hypothetical protein N3D10_00255 [Candidatus Micrarchaeota archaeon]|nr:hypothetical protein [Candidatus Micrarchaeota archaeon]
MKKKLRRVVVHSEKRKEKEEKTIYKFIVKDPTLTKYKFVVHSPFSIESLIKRINYLIKKQ